MSHRHIYIYMYVCVCVYIYIYNIYNIYILPMSIKPCALRFCAEGAATGIPVTFTHRAPPLGTLFWLPSRITHESCVNIFGFVAQLRTCVDRLMLKIGSGRHKDPRFFGSWKLDPRIGDPGLWDPRVWDPGV